MFAPIFSVYLFSHLMYFIYLDEFFSYTFVLIYDNRVSVSNFLEGSVNATTNNAKNAVSDFWSGQSGLMLTSDGRVDALHPFNHQRLSILFSSYSQASESPPAFCVNPWYVIFFVLLLAMHDKVNLLIE